MRKIVVVCLALILAFGLASVAGAQKAASENVTVTGEVIDTYCYSTEGARGMGHKACAMACAKKGIPVGLSEKGDEQGSCPAAQQKRNPYPCWGHRQVWRSSHRYRAKVLTGGNIFLTIESFK